MSERKRFDLSAVKAVSDRSSQKMTNDENVVMAKTTNPKNAGRKPATEKADNKISLNLTKTELERFNLFCVEQGLSIASAIRYCLTKQNAL